MTAPSLLAPPKPAAPARRRGACPTLAEPMPTGDGLLARLRFTAAGLSPDRWIAIADLSRRFGNGLLEVTSRGSLQLRGLDHETAPRLARALDEAGIGIRTGISIETPPLSGVDAAEIADARLMAARIEHAIAERGASLTLASKLAPKLTIVVDGGGRLNLSTLSGDIRLDAVRQESRILWRLAVAGDEASATPLGLHTEDATVTAVLALLETLSAMGPTARGRDLVTSTRTATKPAPASPCGVHDLGGGRALGLRLAFGRTHADELTVLMEGLADLGAAEVRLAPDHALIVLGLSGPAMPCAKDLAKRSGFLTDPAEPANFVSACPGAGFCASARLDTRGTAEAVIEAVPTLFDGSCQVHVSGCEKGCAHPASAALTIVGTEGRADFVLGGRAGDAADGAVRSAEIGKRMARLDALLGRTRRPGETASAVLERAGGPAIAAILKADR